MNAKLLQIAVNELKPHFHAVLWNFIFECYNITFFLQNNIFSKTFQFKKLGKPISSSILDESAFAEKQKPKPLKNPDPSKINL